jgi:hypothetical protein
MIYKPGQMVKLVSHDPEDYMPPIGAVGTVLRGQDDVGDVSVLFHGYPCGTLDGNDWEVPACQLAPATLAPDLQMVHAT